MEDFLEKLMARVREQGVEPRIDPRMDAERAGTIFLTFSGPAEEPEGADSPSPNAPGPRSSYKKGEGGLR
jgi:hypothetical protein